MLHAGFQILMVLDKKIYLQGLISIIKNGMRNNKKIIIYGANKCSRDFIHIDDLAGQ